MKQNGFYIVDKETNHFVCVDFTCGGYPWMSDSITDVHRFNKLDDAVSYRTSFHKQYPNWKIVTIEIVTTEIM